MTPDEDPAELARAIRSAADAVARKCGIPPGSLIVDDLGLPIPFGPYRAGETLDIPKPPPYKPRRPAEIRNEAREAAAAHRSTVLGKAMDEALFEAMASSRPTWWQTLRRALPCGYKGGHVLWVRSWAMGGGFSINWGRPLFSERNGLRKPLLRIGRYRLFRLPPV